MASALLTIKQAALFLDVSEQTLRRWDKSGRLTPQRHQGNRYRLYDQAQLEACAEELRRAAGDTIPPPDASRAGRRSARRTNLASSLSSFVGRARQLETLRTHFDRAERMVTLLGPPGIGKTRLALRYAELSAAPYLDHGGVWFCDLTHASEAGHVAAALAHALSITVPPGTEGAAAVAFLEDALAQMGEAFVIFDNAEGLTRATRLSLGRWCAAAPRARFLTTSRERLGIAGEVVVELDPLELPAEDDASPERLARSEAVALFCARARAIDAAPADDPESLATIARLVRALDGIPLAIELAAARSRLLSPEELYARLPRRLDILASGGTNGRHATLRAAIAWSWTLLAPCERSALAQCAVFAGGFSVEAAEAVVDVCGHAGAPSALEVLWALRDKSLLYVHPSSSRAERRLDLYQSIRSFAGEQLAELGPEIATAVRARHARHYLDAATVWAKALRERGDVRARALLQLEQENLLSVLDEASPASTDERVACVLCLESLLATQGRAIDVIALLDRAAPAGLDTVDPFLRARALLACGTGTGMQGRLADSIVVLESALATAASLGNPPLEGEIRMMLAIRYRQAGRGADALETAERAASQLRGSRAERLEASNQACLGLLLAELGCDAEARVQDQRARAVFRELGDRWSEGLTLGNLAQLDQAAGAFDESRWHYERTLECFQETGDRFYGSIYRGFLGTLEHERGDLAGGRAAYAEAISALARRGAAHVEGTLRACLGALEAEHGELDVAIVELDRAQILLEGVGAPALLAALEIHRGQVDLRRARAAADRGETDRAFELVTRARARLAAAEPVPPTQDVRFAVRMLRRALSAAPGVARDAEAPTPRAAAPLVIGRDARWFLVPEGPRVPLLRRGAVRRLLAALVEQRLEQPGAALGRDRLLALGWPGEKVQLEAGAKRVRVGIATLRALGLRTLIITRDDGYLLDPSVPLALDDSHVDGTPRVPEV